MTTLQSYISTIIANKELNIMANPLYILQEEFINFTEVSPNSFEDELKRTLYAVNLNGIPELTEVYSYNVVNLFSDVNNISSDIEIVDKATALNELENQFYILRVQSNAEFDTNTFEGDFTNNLSILTIDLKSGQLVNDQDLTVAIDGEVPVSGIDYNPLTGTLWGIFQDEQENIVNGFSEFSYLNSLNKIDPLTGTVETFQTFETSSGFEILTNFTLDWQNNIAYIGGHADDESVFLVTVDLNDGTLTTIDLEVDVSAEAPFDGLDYDVASGQLYGVFQNDAAVVNFENSQRRIGVIPPETGQVEIIQEFISVSGDEEEDELIPDYAALDPRTGKYFIGNFSDEGESFISEFDVNTTNLTRDIVTLPSSSDTETPLLGVEIAQLFVAPYLEVLAKEIIYESVAELEANGSPFLIEIGYEIDQVFSDPATDLQALGLTSSNPNLPPILVFRGTESTLDNQEGTNPNGIGAAQFAANQAAIQTWLEQSTQDGTNNPKSFRPIVTGHSLGGSLSQFTVAEFPGLVSQAVTFGSPSVPQSVTDTFFSNGGDASQVNHYVTSGDFVSLAGRGQFIPGTVFLYNYTTPELDPGDIPEKHNQLVLSDAPAGTTFDQISIDQLNADDFTFTDTDYQQFLAALDLLDSDLADSLSDRANASLLSQTTTYFGLLDTLNELFFPSIVPTVGISANQTELIETDSTELTLSFSVTGEIPMDGLLVFVDGNSPELVSEFANLVPSDLSNIGEVEAFDDGSGFIVRLLATNASIKVRTLNDAMAEGTESFTLNILDDENLDVDPDASAIAFTISDEAAPVNSAPIANDDAITLDEDTTITIDVAANDTDIDNNLDLTSVINTTNPVNGSLVNYGDGTFLYTPNSNFNGIDSFTYSILDTGGLSSSATATITVTDVNDLPTVRRTAYIGGENTSLNLDDIRFINAFSDIESDPLTQIQVTSLPLEGMLELNGVAVTVLQEILVSDLNQLIFIPNPNFNGITSFTWRGFDGTQYSLDSATTSLKIFNPLNGNSSAEEIEGGSSNDLIKGRFGNDTLTGNAGNDVLLGGNGNDSVSGGTGNDFLRGGSGADTLDGGDGIDTVDYFTSDTAVTIQLMENTATGGHAEGDLLLNVERVYGSEFDDNLTGSAEANRLLGQAGKDTIDGGAGDDYIRGGSGADALDGGEGIDTIDYLLSDSAVVVNLIRSRGAGGSAQGDRISNIERLYGSRCDDVLIGSAEDNVLFGREGDDLLIGKGGRDVLRGGEGRDRFRFETVAQTPDKIVDFVSGQDMIQLNSTNFGGGLVARAPIAADQFVLGMSAQDANSRFIYDQSAGALFFDPDGLGGIKQRRLAQLVGNPVLSASDIQSI